MRLIFLRTHKDSGLYLGIIPASSRWVCRALTDSSDGLIGARWGVHSNVSGSTILTSSLMLLSRLLFFTLSMFFRTDRVALQREKCRHQRTLSQLYRHRTHISWTQEVVLTISLSSTNHLICVTLLKFLCCDARSCCLTWRWCRRTCWRPGTGWSAWWAGCFSSALRSSPSCHLSLHMWTDIWFWKLLKSPNTANI